MPFRRIYRLFFNIFGKQRVDQDLDLEIHSYVDLLADEKARRGMSRDEAARQAYCEVGGMEQVKEGVRDVRAGVSIDNLLQDIRYALRLLRRNPGFTLTAIVTLALGIGATTAIFSIVDAVLLKPLPFPTADRLIRVRSVLAASGQGDVASYPDFLDWRARNHVFEGLSAFRTDDFTLITAPQSIHLQGAVVSAQLFSLLGVSPVLGRSFLPAEDSPAADNGTDPVILSYRLWQRNFGSDPAVLGRTVRLGNFPYTIIAVMPKGFEFPIQGDSIELWTTIALDARGGAGAITAQRGAHYLDVIGLLKPGIKPQQAQPELAAIASALNKEHPENKPRTVRVVPEIQGLVGPLRVPLLVLLGAVLCVLLIVCVNLANLLLARANGRQKEMAVRAALGASRRRAISQLLIESLTLSLLGGALGVAAAVSSLGFLVHSMPADVPRVSAAGLDARLLLFALLITIVAGVSFGLAPACEVTKIGLADSLKDRQHTDTGAAGHARLRRILVISEIALTVVLLLGASLLIRSFHHLTQVNPGFDGRHVLTFQLDISEDKPGQSHLFLRQVIEKLTTLPGVQLASAAVWVPLTGDFVRSSIEIEGHPMPLGSRPSADFNAIEPNYFRTIGVSLIQGRDFTVRDDPKSTPVVIINRTLAQRFFPNQNPIGQHVRPGVGNGYGTGEPPMREIVGVVADVKQSDIASDTAPEIYAPLAQSPFGTLFIAVIVRNDPRTIIESARRQVVALDKERPVYHIETLEGYVERSIARPRFVMLLLGGFAGVALLLACVGVYGVVSYTVVQRTNEIGIRVALGAGKNDVLRMVLVEGLKPAVVGLVLGILGAFKLTSLLSILLYGVTPTDPLTFISVSILLVAVTMLACYIPARRAAGVDPLISLR